MVATFRLKYYLYRATTSWGFYVPVSVVYLVDAGFGLSFIALTQAVFSVALLTAELPTGYLGDRLGRRVTLGIGSALRAFGLIIYGLMDTAAAILLAQVLFAVGWGFGSGTVGAWGYELLAAHSGTDGYARMDGRGRAADLTVSAVAAVAGGALYTVHSSLPFLANGALAAAGIPILVSATPVPKERADADPLGIRDGLVVVRSLLARAELRWVVIFVTAIFAVFDLSKTFEQPALQSVGVSTAQLGVLFGALKLLTAGAASTAGWINDRMGARRGLGLVVPILGSAYLAVLFLPLAVIPAVVLYRTNRSIVKPLRNQYLNDRLADAGRATALSGVSMLGAITAAVLRLAAGPVAERVGPVDVIGMAGVVLLGIAAIVYLVTDPFCGHDQPAQSCAPTD